MSGARYYCIECGYTSDSYPDMVRHVTTNHATGIYQGEAEYLIGDSFYEKKGKKRNRRENRKKSKVF